MYKPNPIDTSHVVLTKEQIALIERFSENTHDVWAATRIAEGWVYGPKRDDDAKEHPCLVPYADLPESEKVYDRTIVEQLIKAILANGYRFERTHY